MRSGHGSTNKNEVKFQRLVDALVVDPELTPTQVKERFGYTASILVKARPIARARAFDTLRERR